jgi:hypothetical protein
LILDPVITVHPDRLFFEAFSRDQSVYAMVVLNPEMFATEANSRLAQQRPISPPGFMERTHNCGPAGRPVLRIGSEGFEVQNPRRRGRFEQKVDLPDNWVRGFLQVTGAMAMPGTRLTARPADLLAAIRFFRYNQAKLSHELCATNSHRAKMRDWFSSPGNMWFACAARNITIPNLASFAPGPPQTESGRTAAAFCNER